MTFAPALDFTGREWSLIHEERPWSLNTERTWHHQTRARFVKSWRYAFRILALEAKVPRLQACAVSVRPLGVRQDIGNCYGAAKAGIDGLVDAGVIENDTPEFLGAIVFLPPERGVPALEIVVHELQPMRLPVL